MPEHLVRDVKINPERPGWVDTCLSSIGGSKNWEDRTLGGYFGSPSMRDLCQVITVEPNVWLAGETFQVRIRGGFPAHVEDLALTLTDAAGGEYDILAEAGPLTDWDTGEVLYSCEGVRLDDAQWGVVEEAPADSDRWRTIVARVSLPDEVEVGYCDLDMSFATGTGSTSIDLDSVLLVIGMKFVEPTYDETGTWTGDFNIVNKMPVWQPCPEVAIDPIAPSDITVNTDGTLSLTVSGSVTDALADIIADNAGDIAEVHIYVPNVVDDDGNAFKEPVSVARSSTEPTSLIRPYAFRGTFSKQITFPAQPGENIVVVESSQNVLGLIGRHSVSVVADIRPGGRYAYMFPFTVTMTAPFSPTQPDSIEVSMPNLAFPQTLVETGDDTREFHASYECLGGIFTIDVAITSLSGPLGDRPDFMNVVLSDTQYGFDNQSFILVEDAADSLTFSSTHEENPVDCNGAFAEDPLNVCLTALPTPGVVDQLYAFTGFRNQQPYDAPFVETSVDSMTFTGDGDGLGSATIEYATATGLQAEIPDQLGVWVTSASLSLVSLPAVLIETGNHTAHFRMLAPAFGDDRVVEVTEVIEHEIEPQYFVPFLVTVDLPEGVDPPGDITLNGVQYGLQQVGDDLFFDEVFVICPRSPCHPHEMFLQKRDLIGAVIRLLLTERYPS